MFKSRILSQTIFIIKRKYSSQETDIIFETLSNAGIITLNRPKSVNALNASMTEKLTSHLTEWEKNKNSLKVSLKALQRGAQLERPQRLQMENRLVVHSIENHDFPEGVRALLINKDNKPQWNPRTLAEVNDEYIERFFKRLPDDKELKLDPTFL